MACESCLRRGFLLRALAGHLDRAVDRAASRRARDLLALDDEALTAAVGADRSRIDAAADEAAAAAGLLAEHRCWATCRHEGDWPGGLALLGAGAPRALFGRGRRSRLAVAFERPAATIVGARRAGAYGLEVATALGEQLAAAGLTVVSGMALGADTAAHRGALEVGGLTCAVLGAGPERPYPAAAAGVYERIVSGGLVLSELPPLSPTFRWAFPARNRLMAVLGEITIVVEAAERSGSLITAEMAADCGRLVGAVPGPVSSWRSAGANLLLADGAAVIRGPEDVLDRLLGVGEGRIAIASGRPLSPEEAATLDALEAGAASADAIVAVTGLAAPAALDALARLELAGYLRADAGGRLARTALPAPPREGAPPGANTMGA